MKLPGLEALRGLAVLMVMFTHFTTHHATPFMKEWLYPNGQGVDLFFVVSGCVVTWSLMRNPNFQGLIAFWIRRFFRVVPLAASGLIVSWFLISRGQGVEVANSAVVPDAIQMVQFKFNSALSAGKQSYFIRYWSLSVEMLFYLGFPFLFLILKKFRTAPVILLALAVLDAAYLRKGAATYVEILRMDPLFLGAMIAFTSEKLASFRFRSSLVIRALGWLGLLGLIRGPSWLIQEGVAPWIDSTWSISVCSAMLVAVAIIRNELLPWGGGQLGRFLERVGARSFSLYIAHSMTSIWGWTATLDPWPRLILLFGLSFVGAEILHRLVEKPTSILGGRVASVFATGAS